MFYVGADACKAGWFTVMLTEGTDWSVDVFLNISSLWNRYKDARLILLDVPIGLRERESNERSCDKEARELLGRQRCSSVFVAPSRLAIQADTYETVNEINARNTGRKLYKQTWGITPKIREVDKFLLTNLFARSRIRETHPEVCFSALAGHKPMKYSKKKKAGFLERMEVLRRVYPYTKDLVDQALRRYPRSEVARDDILDALVTAVTASAQRRGLSSIPERTEIDSQGLPMEIVYYFPRW